jgi:uncharacterized protein YbaA (DUF1428 family)
MNYIDGFLIPVPADRKEDYRRIATAAAEVFREYGALAVVECWGDDVPAGEVTSFPMAVKAEPGEVVVFSWIVWPSKEVRDQGNAKAMADPRMRPPEGADIKDWMPFDGRRMMYGGFDVLVESSAAR